MTTRRNFIAGVSGTAAVGVAGCLGFFDDEDTDEITGPDTTTDDQLLRALADPSAQVPPLFFAGYQYRVGELMDDLDVPDVAPRLGGSIAGLFEDQLEEVSLADLDRLSGGIYNSTASAGELEIDPLPSGEAVHATGEFTAEPIMDWIEARASYEHIGEANGYERYVAEIQEGQGFEALAVRDDVFIATNRTDVTARNVDYDTPEETAEDALATEFDQREREDAPIVRAVPAFAETVGTLDDGPIRAGTAYALVPLGSDIGIESHDAAVNGVVATGLSTDLDSLQRSVTYLDEDTGSADTLESAFADSDTEELPVDGWEFDSVGPTVTARTDLSETPSRAMLQTALPVAGYDSLFQRINPSHLGRDVPPRVFFQPRIDDGALEIEHIGGETVEDLRVRYVHDGDAQHVMWEGEIREGSVFRSEETIDSGSRSWVVWRPDTVDAAVLTRFETPA